MKNNFKKILFLFILVFAGNIFCVSGDAKLKQGNFEDIKSLNLSYSNITDKLLMKLAKCTNLKKLSLLCCYEITNDQLASLPSSLKKLNLWNCYCITGDGLAKLALRCPNLESLDLSNPTDELLVGLAKCTNLKKLKLHCYDITNKQLAMLPAGLEDLRFYNSGITDEGLNILLEKCPHLTSLDLTWCKVTDKGIALLSEKRPNFINLGLSCCQNLTDGAIQFLPIFLKKLDLSDCYNLTNDGFAKVSTRCPYLTDLNLSANHLRDEGLAKLLEGCSNLTSLNLANCHELIGMGLTKLAKQCPLLEDLDLMWCENITDEVLANLPASLKRLDLYCCLELTDRGIEKLSKCSNLMWVDLTDIDHISNAVILALSEKLPNLKIQREMHHYPSC